MSKVERKLRRMARRLPFAEGDSIGISTGNMEPVWVGCPVAWELINTFLKAFPRETVNVEFFIPFFNNQVSTFKLNKKGEVFCASRNGCLCLPQETF